MFAFLPEPQLVVRLLVQGLHFENHWTWLTLWVSCLWCVCTGVLASAQARFSPFSWADAERIYTLVIFGKVYGGFPAPAVFLMRIQLGQTPLNNHQGVSEACTPWNCEQKHVFVAMSTFLRILKLLWPWLWGWCLITWAWGRLVSLSVTQENNRATQDTKGYLEVKGEMHRKHQAQRLKHCMCPIRVSCYPFHKFSVKLIATPPS